ncbi:MAG: UvrD-helicase domain-containing protein, partial [Ignavibacteria bacterium]|nr:UvrD-helicase domain-containing protein [Ignavibacteria bacterium]
RMSIVLSPQQKKALDIDRSIALTANAGSGKTFILSKRFLEVILNRTVDIREIVAITFTDKASAELLNKISADIDEYLPSCDVSKKQELLRFRELITSAKISTIHSFCADILKRYPIEAGIDSNFSIIDDAQKSTLINDLIDETFRENLNDEKVKDLLRIFTKEKLFKKISAMIEKRHMISEIETYFYSTDFHDYYEKIKDIYQKYFSEGLPLLKINELVHVFEELSNILNGEIELKFNSYLAQVKDFLIQKDYLNFIIVLNTIFDLLLIKDRSKIRVANIQKEYRKTGTVDNFNKIISEFIKHFEHFFKSANFEGELENKRYELVKVLLRAFRHANGKYENYKISEGVLDYNDLLIKVNELLNNEQVRQELSSSIKNILVDEFQDTDSIQFSIIRKLMNDFDAD